MAHVHFFETRSLWSPLSQLHAFFEGWQRRRKALDALDKLSDLALDDIGVHRHDIARIVDRDLSRLQIEEFRSRC